MAAMTDINIVSESGNLTRDAEFRAVGQSGVLNFSIAVNESQKNQDGTWGSYANYLDVSYFSKGAEKLGQYLKKGTPVVVQGHLHQDRWEGKDGQKNSRIVIRADNIKLCGGSKGSSNGGSNGSQPMAPSNSDGMGFSEDIPF